MVCGTEYRSPASGRFSCLSSMGMPPHSLRPTPHQQLLTSPGKVRQPPTLAVLAPLLRSWRTALSAMPMVSSTKVLEKSAEISGVKLLPSDVERSFMPLAAAVNCIPGSSSGRGVRMLRVAPMPPVGTSAWPVLYTSTALTPSEARLPKSKERPRPSDVGICRPFNSTRLKCGPKPRTVTRAPSPRSRSMETPVMRCSDSARLVSGKSPMSSAVMASTTPSRARLKSIDSRRLCRMPTTTTSSMSLPLASSATALAATPPPTASDTASASRLGRRACSGLAPKRALCCFDTVVPPTAQTVTDASVLLPARASSVRPIAFSLRPIRARAQLFFARR